MDNYRLLILVLLGVLVGLVVLAYLRTQEIKQIKRECVQAISKADLDLYYKLRLLERNCNYAEDARRTLKVLKQERRKQQ